MEFYSVSAQIIIVLLLALTVESRFGARPDVHPSRLEKLVSRQNGIAIYLWACTGLLVSLLRLAGFNFWNLEGGKVAVMFSILTMLVYLGLLILLGESENTKTRTTYQLSLTTALALAPATLALWFEPRLGWAFTLKDADALILSLTFLVTAIPIGMAFFRNRKSF